MKHPSKLSKSFIERVAHPGRYGDGRGGFGLSLLVKERSSGGWSKSFSQRILVAGKPVSIGLGAYPVVTLQEARASALANRRSVSQGQAVGHREAKAPTFEEAAETVLAMYAANWRDSGKSVKQWRASMRDYAQPILPLRVDRITTSDVLAVLTPIWNSKRETASRVRTRIGQVMKWAVAQGHRADNPAGDAVVAALPKAGQKREHLKAMPYAEVADALRKVEATGAYRATVYALDFIALTASRSGEVRGAQWSEIDLERAVWTIPASRMKIGVEHRIPLSTGALAVLEKAGGLSDGSGLVFPSVRGKELTDNTLSKLLRENAIACVPHGFRSSFRDWAAESGYTRETAEAALAHAVKNQVEAAYFRTTLFDARADMMEAWSGFLGRACANPS